MCHHCEGLETVGSVTPVRRADLLLHQLHDVVWCALSLAVARMQDAPRQVDQGDVGALPAGCSYHAAVSSHELNDMLRADVIVRQWRT